MALDDAERLVFEDMIFECQYAAEKYLATGKEAHGKMLRSAVDQCYEMMEDIQKGLISDEEAQKYKLHLLVPFQIVELMKMEQAEQNL